MKEKYPNWTMKEKNLNGRHERKLRFGYAFASFPFMDKKQYLCNEIRKTPYTLFEILPRFEVSTNEK